MPMKKSLKWTALFLLAVMLYSLLCAVSILQYAEPDEAAPADVIIVLGAGTNGKTPNAVFRERLNHGIRLYENGYADYILITGGLTPGNEHSDAWIAGQYVLEQGVPEEAVLLEERSTITQENLQYAKEIMDSEDLSTAIIVSDPLHMKRSMLMAKDYEIEAFSSPTTTTRYQTWKSKLPFLAREVFFYVGYQAYRLFTKP